MHARLLLIQYLWSFNGAQGGSRHAVGRVVRAGSLHTLCVCPCCQHGIIRGMLVVAGRADRQCSCSVVRVG
jgi:hypothetical protein